MYNLIVFTNHINTHTQLSLQTSPPHFTSKHFCAIHFRPFSNFLISHNLPNFNHTISPLNLTVMNVIQIAFFFILICKKGK